MILPQLPHCSRTLETQASFSREASPTSSARAWPTGSSSQKTQRRHRDGRSSRLSRVILARRRDNEAPLLPTAANVTCGAGHPLKLRALAAGSDLQSGNSMVLTFIRSRGFPYWTQFLTFG